MAKPTTWPRLMSRQMAAAYCDMSVSTFERVCPVTPISLSEERMDKRLLRYDAAALDEWINALSGRRAGDPEHVDWASKVFG